MLHARRKRLLLAIAGVLVVLGGALLVWMDRHPVDVPWLDDRDPEAPSIDAFSNEAAPVLLISSLEDLARAARARDFDRMDWSLAWRNLLEQEVGWFAHREYVELGAEPWTGRALVIVAHSAIARCTPAEIAELAAFVAAGGVLLLDRPGPAWEALSGLRLGPERRREGRISAAAPDVLAPEVRAELQRAGIPLPVRLHALDSPLDAGLETLLAFDGEPALVARPAGRGAVVSVLFDLGWLLVTVQQGRPEPDYRVAKRWGFYRHLLESHDLVWHESYLRNAVPAADVLERAVLAAACRFVSLPVWWAFPREAMGLLLMTHDEDEYGADRCRLLLDHEVSIGARSTFFLLSGRRMEDGWPADAVRHFAAQGADLALHWNRLPAITGLWKLEPIARVFALADQVDFFRETQRRGGLPAGPLLNRNHYLMWASPAEFRAGDTHYTRTFRILHRHGIVMDSTYGPNREGRGYLFGTGRPFHPLDVDGKHIPLREMPFLSQEDWGGEDEAWFGRLFAESEAWYHSAICCIFHPHLIVREEAGERLWKSVYASAARHRHAAVSFREYHDFLEARRASPLRFARADDGALRIECEAEGPDLAVLLRGTVHAVELDGQPVDRPGTLSLDGQRCTLVAVPAGRHVLVIRDGNSR
ncbi:MAG: hypothetical protein JXQ29_03885 [Planctomycetes bacterium]|nr:hypothetical protein [Planctomycetota bacterium]